MTFIAGKDFMGDNSRSNFEGYLVSRCGSVCYFSLHKSRQARNRTSQGRNKGVFNTKSETEVTVIILIGGGNAGGSKFMECCSVKSCLSHTRGLRVVKRCDDVGGVP